MKATLPLAAAVLCGLAACSTPATPAPATQPATVRPTATTPATPAPAPTTASASATTVSPSSGPTTTQAPPTASAPVTTAAPPRPSSPATRKPAPSPSRTNPPSQVVLGADLPGRNDVGLGTARPASVNFGGHPTTILRQVTWTSWGGTTATGTAEAMWVAPGQSTVDATWQKAKVTASAIGTCAGKRAYTRLVWTFPGKPGEQPVPFNACTGISIS